MDSINIYVGDSKSGNRVYENIRVISLGKDVYKLLTSPGLVLGIAKDDEIKFFTDSGEFKLLNRGRNLCIQLYLSSNIHREVDDLISQLEGQLGASLDGRTDKQIVFSVPVESGFLETEKMLNKFIQDNSNCEWHYGNVYETEDGQTPLNWWV